jgi:hypothetical protein
LSGVYAVKARAGLGRTSSADFNYKAINLMALDLAGQLNGAEVRLMDEVSRPIGGLGDERE